MTESTRFDINDVLNIASRVIKDPAEFYRNMPRSGGYTQPLIFIVVTAVITGLLFSILSLITGARLGAMTAGFMSIFFLPLVMIIGCFIAAALLFVIWKLLGSTQDYQTAFRCQAFASAIFPITALLSLVPYLGTAVAVAWSIWLVINASIEVHGIERQRALLVFGLIGAVVLVFNLNGEYAARQMQERVARMDTQMQDSLNNLENMSPEEAGKALGEFLKGIEQGASGEDSY